MGKLVFLYILLQTITLSKSPGEILTEPYTGIEFILIGKGDFLMGEPSDSITIPGSDIPHRVVISGDFWMSRTEITLAQWQKVMGRKELHTEKPNPFRNDNQNYPVVSVSYNDVQDFLSKLNRLSPGYKFRLPTEAEWEYACRAGTNTNFSFGDTLSDSEACYNAACTSAFSRKGEKSMHPAPVGSYQPNQWGLYDMHGNAWEWVSDWFAPYKAESLVDPSGPPYGKEKVIRGGSWYFCADNAKSSSRRAHDPDLWGFSIGFRIVCENDNRVTCQGN